MADEPDNIVLEHLRAIRGDVSQIKANTAGVMRRMDTLQSEMALVHRKLADMAMEMSQISDRLDRLERRTGLVDIP
jgi:hypothetical protein